MSWMHCGKLAEEVAIEHFDATFRDYLSGAWWMLGLVFVAAWFAPYSEGRAVAGGCFALAAWVHYLRAKQLATALPATELAPNWAALFFNVSARLVALSFSLAAYMVFLPDQRLVQSTMMSAFLVAGLAQQLIILMWVVWKRRR